MNITNVPILVSLWRGLNTPLTQFNILPLNVLEQAIIFWSIWYFLNRLFFRSYARVYEKRNAMTVRAIEEARLLNKESEDLEGALSAKINEAVRVADGIRLAGVEAAKKRREDMLRQASEAMQGKLKSMMADIEKEKTEMLRRLDSDIRQFIPAISKKMMLR